MITLKENLGGIYCNTIKEVAFLGKLHLPKVIKKKI